MDGEKGRSRVEDGGVKLYKWKVDSLSFVTAGHNRLSDDGANKDSANNINSGSESELPADTKLDQMFADSDNRATLLMAPLA